MMLPCEIILTYVLFRPANCAFPLCSNSIATLEVSTQLPEIEKNTVRDIQCGRDACM